MRLALILVALVGMGAGPSEQRPTTRPAPTSPPSRDEITILWRQVNALQKDIASLRSEVRQLRAELAAAKSPQPKVATHAPTKRKPIDPNDVERMDEVGGDRIPAR